MCNQDIPTPTAGKLTALNAKGRVSKGQPIQAQPDCKTNCSLYSVSPALAYQLKGTINEIPTNFVLGTLLSHDHWSGLGASQLGMGPTWLVLMALQLLYMELLMLS